MKHIVRQLDMTNEYHIEVSPHDLSFAEAITRFQVDMAMESEGFALDYERTLFRFPHDYPRMERLELLLVSMDTECLCVTGT